MARLCAIPDTSKIDTIAFQGHWRDFIIDPTVRFETCTSQPQDVHKEKQFIYEPTIPYYQEKYQLQQTEVIGLMVGARGSIPKQFVDFCKGFSFAIIYNYQCFFTCVERFDCIVKESPQTIPVLGKVFDNKLTCKYGAYRLSIRLGCVNLLSYCRSTVQALYNSVRNIADMDVTLPYDFEGGDETLGSLRTISKLFWAVCVLLSWYGSAYLIRSSWIAFQNNPINFGVETTYLQWNTKFPSVIICENDNDDYIEGVMRIHLPQFFANAEDEDMQERAYSLIDVYRELAFFRGSPYYMRTNCFEDDVYDETNKCPTGNYSEVVKLLLILMQTQPKRH
ncbi:hypothetical protein ANN_19454 [Periplaneta americana]|uniref:Uncharacterized protein n=1 Tax=Periplaneta americana TaxID=6978 RepID=A0ABQ8SA54_PERAM|nr:hypothetical protein ANN_19454 [Periplaneta americana]